MARSDRHSAKQKSSFMKFYLAYVMVLALALAALFFYVRGVMVDYEKSSSDKYILNMIGDSGSDLEKYLQANAFDAALPGDGAARKASYESLVKSASLEAKQSKKSYDSAKPIYDITADGKPIMTVALNETAQHTKLGILTLSDWEVAYAFLRSEDALSGSGVKDIKISDDGLYGFEVTMPQGYTLMLDGKEYQPAAADISTKEIEDFELVKAYTEVPGLVSFKLEGLSFEPAVSFIDNAGQLVAVSPANGKYEIKAQFASSKEAEDMAAEVFKNISDPITIAETWSKFMTNDIGGASHGFDKVVKTCRLVKGTNIYTLVKNFSTSVDITFVSKHVIDSITNQKASNFIKYSDKFFSCDTYLEKNMTLSTGLKPVDVFSYRMFFVYIEDSKIAEPGWYMVDMLPV